MSDDIAPDEPGDDDALPHVPTTPAEELPPDEGDIGKEPDDELS